MAKIKLAVIHPTQELKLNVTRLPLKNRCSRCGDPYYRRNATEAWTSINDGHRYGWSKEIAKVCLECAGEAEGKRIIGIANVQFSKTIRKRA